MTAVKAHGDGDRQGSFRIPEHPGHPKDEPAQLQRGGDTKCVILVICLSGWLQ